MTARHTFFPKASRLNLASDFRDLLKNGTSFWENGIVIYLRKSDVDNSRLGIVISKRVLKRATDRNRAKRIIREFYRREKNNFVRAFDVIVRITGDCKLFYQNNLRSYLKQLFSRVGLY